MINVRAVAIAVALAACSHPVTTTPTRPAAEPAEPNFAGECNFVRKTWCLPLPRTGECVPSIARSAPTGEIIGDDSDHVSPAETARHPGQCCYIEFTATECD